MKAGLQLNVSQSLKLRPQLQQAIRLLQLSTVDLNQEIQTALQKNPMLELKGPDNSITIIKSADINHNENDFSIDTNESFHYPSAPPKMNSNNDAINYEHFYGTQTNLQEHLTWQLRLSSLSELDKAIAYALIDAIDDDGFLTLSIKEIRESITSKQIPITFAATEAVRHFIMRLEPVGCASKNLQECLLVQGVFMTK